MTGSSIVLGLLGLVLFLAGLALWSPRVAVTVAGVLCLAASAGQLDDDRDPL